MREHHGPCRSPARKLFLAEALVAQPKNRLTRATLPLSPTACHRFGICLPNLLCSYRISLFALGRSESYCVGNGFGNDDCRRARERCERFAPRGGTSGRLAHSRIAADFGRAVARQDVAR